MPRKWPPGTFPNSVRAWREHKNLTQAALVERLRDLGVRTTTASLSRVENGSQNYDAELLNGLSDALGRPPQDLVMRRPPSKDQLELYTVIDGMKPPQRRLVLELAKAVAAGASS